MKKLFFLLTFILCLSGAFAQDYHKIDSLRQILKTLPELDGTDEDTNRIKIVIDLGMLYEKKKPDSSILLYNSVADTGFSAENIRLHPKKAGLNATALRYMGIVCYHKGNFSDACFYYNKSMRISEELEDLRGISSCLTNLGVAASNQGNYREANDYYKRSLKIKEQEGDKSGISYCLVNLGVVEWNQGHYPEAISYYEESLLINEELGDNWGISYCLNNLGIVSRNLGNYKEAISFYNRSLKLFEEINDIKGISNCLMNLGIVARNQGNYKDAKSYYERSLILKEQSGDKRGISNCLNNLGIVEHYQRNYSEAISFYNQSLKISEELGDKSGISLALINLGVMESSMGNYERAVSYYEKSIRLKEELGSISSLAKYYPALARAYLKINKPEQAFPLFLKSEDLTFRILQDNFATMSEQEKELFLEQTKGVFNDIHFSNIEYNNPHENLSGICYNNELIIKGLLLKSTQQILDIVYNSPDAEIKKLYFSLKYLRNNISVMQTAMISNRDSIIADLEAKANEQERKLVKMSSGFADIQQLFEYKWEDVQKNLKPGEAAIEFVSFTRGDRNDTIVYAALLITPETTNPASIKLFEETQLQTIVGSTTETGFGFINSLYGTNTEINYSLYNLIWKPLDKYLNGINSIYYAPAGILNKVSFAALGNENGQFLSDKYNLHQMSSTGKLINPDENETTLRNNAAIFGGIDYNPDTVKLEMWKYLEGTLKEKEQIEKQFKKSNVACITYSGKEAREEAFKSLFDSTDAPSILHVSTHGFFYPDPELVKKEVKVEVKVEDGELDFRGSNGFGNWMFLNNKNPMMRSGLVFAGANRVWSEDWGRTDNEGVLTAYEVSNLNMRNTQLVVLSACETGLGDIKGSEGVYGLQRAFKMAGVKYIIMSLWQVPDIETVEFMEMFYKKLLKEKDVRMAFNETQKEMRKKYDPYYWAAFVLIE